MDSATFCEQLEELFELDAGDVTPQDLLHEIPGWTSLTFMGLIALVDEEYGVTLRPAAIVESTTVADLMAMIEGEGQQAAA